MSVSTIEAKSPAILAIGTANPANCYYQQDYPDFLLRVTNCDHMTELKDRVPSLDPRQDMLIPEVPKLGKEAALKAIEEWGLPISNITHLIFCTASCVDMPAADFQLVKLLGLDSSVNRFMIYQQGCFAGGTVLRLAKDVAENNPGARILVVFEIMSTRGTIVPYSEHGVVAHLREMGFEYCLSPDVPKLVGANIEEILVKGFREIDGINNDWNSLFYSIHPGGPAILDKNSMDEGKATTGEGLEWAVLIETGLGLIVETVVLRSVRIAAC
ncbi:hypothetical protein L3X38_024659 [Prunus dulcis]|uniref:Chalcone and stilbene synthase family protein n=1 Tax=Prunus dulcis TaxID=3755 RepID=A0AAD4W125_PRUDU|nr:hypothetical protein L3X38_024659 [Prunus dulcis]